MMPAPRRYSDEPRTAIVWCATVITFILAMLFLPEEWRVIGFVILVIVRLVVEGILMNL